MIDELQVRDIALVEEAALAFSPRFTVLTGETGAGKTALLSALRLISGQRGDAHMVRSGTSEAQASARLIDASGEEHILSRRFSAQGRSRCEIDGSMASVGQLAQAASSVHIHNQHEQVLLLQPATQLAYLDAWEPEARDALESYRGAFTAYQQASKACEELEQAASSQAQELEYLRFVKAQIDEVKPQEGEYEQLESELPRLQNAESLAQALGEANEALGADAAACDMLAQAQHALERQAGIDPELDALVQRLTDIQASLDDIARDLRSYALDIEHNPQVLQETLSRLDALNGLMRRYGPGMEQVLETYAQAQAKLAAADASPEQLDAARRKRDEAAQKLREAAAALTTVRKEAGAQLCEQLQDSVADLAMAQARFSFAFEELPFERWTHDGPARVELLYAPASGTQARPLSRVASGGELSRILLALECVRYSQQESAARENTTLVFDEVDQGIGGAVGEAVAQRLLQLSSHAQVIVVTHLPQVAALADAHLVVSKVEDASGSVTTVAPVEGEARVAEVARMLAGREDATALEHARTLLKERA